MNKREVSNVLQKIAFAAELKEDTTLNAAGIQAAAWTIRSIEGDIETLVADGALKARRDLVKDAVRIITELVETGVAADLVRLSEGLPSGLFEIRKLKGLGPKKIRALWSELGITSLTELEYACQENRLVDLKGFGKKTQANVLAGIDVVRQFAGQWRLDQARIIAMAIVDALRASEARAIVVGAIRRCEETVHDICIVTTGTREVVDAAVAAANEGMPTAEDDAPRSASENSAADVIETSVRGVKTTVHLVEDARFSGAVFQHTGPAVYVDLVSAHAATQGNQLSTFTVAGAPLSVPDDTTADAGVFSALGLSFTPPERRHQTTVLAFAGKAQPELVSRAALKGALHNHTTESDGTHSLVDMRNAAAGVGLQYLGITEHSVAAAYAGGLDAARIQKQRGEIAKLNAEGQSCVLLTGIESDILKDGSLDTDNETLSALDVVVASVHQRYSLSRDEATVRMQTAARHPFVDVVGHPTGRLLLGRAPVDFDVEAWLSVCRDSHVVVELNANPARLDLSAPNLEIAKAMGIKVSIAADAHSVDALSHLDYGIMTARRAGLTVDDVINTRSVEELRAVFADHRRHRASA